MTEETWKKVEEQREKYEKKHKRCKYCACHDDNICLVKDERVYRNDGRFCRYYVPKEKECD